MKNAGTHLGIGDDAALLEAGEEWLAVSSESFVENVHFDLGFHPLKHLGYKIVVAGISDIIAMNAIPEQILINISISNRFSLEAVEEFYAGVKIATEKYKVDLVGGDTGSSTKGLIIAITALGRVKKDKVTLRKGAQANDLLVLSGDIGAAYMGLQILEREKRVFLEHPSMQPDLQPYDYIVGRQLKPEARLDVIQLLEDLGVQPTSMMDVTDGVASEIFHLGRQSEIGFDIYEEKIPIDPQTLDTALTFGLNPSIAALNGGDDFELLFTVKPADYEKIRNQPDLTIIGHATDRNGSHRLVTAAGQAFEIKAQGWEANEQG